jgi:hypothetical protein
MKQFEILITQIYHRFTSEKYDEKGSAFAKTVIE